TLELDTASSSTSKEVPTGILGAAAYAGLFFYNDNENQVTFTAAKDLNALLEYIKKDYPHARRGQNIYFRFQSDDGYIELIFNAPQEKPFTDGWTVMPHLKPCRLHRFDINGFGEANYPLPPSCLISVYASSGAVPSLHYSVPLDGVADPVTLFITRALRTISPST
uniref:Uncharacterized protein n=1 Tax=Amphimedon queenslandica TaxID=400682 RepID=A0A1X7SE93_AMPQE